MAVPAPLTWPALLTPSAETWRLRGGSRSGGQTLAGNEQISVGPSARMVAALTVPCFDRGRVLAMRALLAGLDGRAGTVRVGPCEASRAPWNVDPLTGGRISYGRGDRAAATDPAFAANPDTTARLDFRLAADAALNATALTVRRFKGGVIEPGMIFSIGDRLHIVTALPDGERAAPGVPGPEGLVVLRIRPWLRADHAAGTALEFGRPLGTMRLASDDTGALDLQLSRIGTVTLDLEEVF